MPETVGDMTPLRQPEIIQRAVDYCSHQAGKGIDSLVALMERTGEDWRRCLDGVSEAQAQFSPAEDEWTTKEVVTHFLLATSGVNKQIGELTKTFDGSGRPAMPAAEWNALCQSPFAPIVAVANKALDLSIARAEAVQAKALTNLIVQSLAFLLALAVTLAGVFVVRNRLMRPVRAILDAIARISARDYATPVPQSRHPDEFGTMAAALESLRESAATAER